MSWRLRVRACAKASRHVITVSESSADDVMTLCSLPASRITVIPHGIDLERFNENPSLQPLDQYELPDCYFLYVGNLDPRKNVAPLIEAMSSSVIRRSGVPLIIAGRAAWGVERLLANIRSAPNVRWLGPVADDVVPALMARSMAFVFPSLYEGFGFPVLEAAACGTVVLTTRAGALKDVGQDVSFDIGDPSTVNILNGLLRVLEMSGSERASITQGFAAQARTYTWDRAWASHSEVFRACA